MVLLKRSLPAICTLDFALRAARGQPVAEYLHAVLPVHGTEQVYFLRHFLFHKKYLIAVLTELLM